MKKVRVIITALCCMCALGAAFAVENPLLIAKKFRIDQATGLPIAVVAPGYYCSPSGLICTRDYETDANGQPTTEVPNSTVRGTYIAP